MITSTAALGLWGCILAAPLRGQAPAATELSYPVVTPETVIQTWPKTARLIARTMIEEYGEPDEFDGKAISWSHNSPWRRTIVNRYPLPAGFSPANKGLLFQSIGYRVPMTKFSELARFDPRIVVDRAAGELACRSDSEKMNLLALNLADEIILGRRNAAQARRIFEKVSRLTQAGKSSKYTEGLIRDKELDRLAP
jgi:hypothetical protein